MKEYFLSGKKDSISLSKTRRTMINLADNPLAKIVSFLAFFAFGMHTFCLGHFHCECPCSNNERIESTYRQTPVASGAFCFSSDVCHSSHGLPTCECTLAFNPPIRVSFVFLPFVVVAPVAVVCSSMQRAFQTFATTSLKSQSVYLLKKSLLI